MAQTPETNSTDHQSDGEHAPEAHSPEHHAAGHKKGHGHGDGHGGGGHGGGWLMTYCDMITLLMTFFICLLTFSANETGKNGMPRKRDSVVYGMGGTGIVRDRKQGTDRESIIWRQLPAVYQLNEPGSELPPMYSDPALESTAAVLKQLDGSQQQGSLADSYEMRITVNWFIDSGPKLSDHAKEIVRGIANHVRNLPYTIRVEVEEAAALDKGLALADSLVKNNLVPSRIGVGLRPRPPAASANMWLVFKRNQ